MATQTGSIDLTASNGVKLMAEAGFDSAERTYATKSALGVQADRISMVVENSDASGDLTLTADALEYIGDHVEIKGTDGTSTVISGGQIQTGSLSIGSLDSSTQTAISNGAKTATDYVTDINNNGITVHPKRSDYATNGGRAVINADGLTIYLGSDDVASYGASARIGKANSDRVTVDSTNGITIYKGNSKRLQTTANGIDVYGSDGTTSIASFGSTVTLASDDNNHLVLDGNGLEFLDQGDNRLFYIDPYDGNGIPEDSMVTLDTDSGFFVVRAGGLAYLSVGSDEIILFVKKGSASETALYANDSEVGVQQPLYAYAGATASYQLLAQGTQNAIALRANSAGNRGLYDVTSDEWILYRNYNTDKLVLNVQLANLAYEEGSCTIESSATEYNVNSCWSNGATCTITVSVNLKSALANGGTVLIATAPSGYRPPFNVIGSCYITGATASAMAIIGTGGGITLNNRSGSSISTSANVYVSFTFAPA